MELVRIITLAPQELRHLVAHNVKYSSSYARQLQEDFGWIDEFWSLADSCPVPPPTRQCNLFQCVFNLF